MELIELTEPDRQQKIYINKAQIFSVFYSDAFKCVMVMASGGGMVKVSESTEEINNKLRTKEN